MQVKRQKSTNFCDFITNLRVSQHYLVRKDILERCDVSRTTFSKWVRGVAVPREANKQIINQIATNYGYHNVY